MHSIPANLTLLLQLLAASRGPLTSEDTILYTNPPKPWNPPDGCYFTVYEKDECVAKRNFPFVIRIRPPTANREKRNALRCQRWLWPRGVVPFDLRMSDPAILSRFYAAVAEIQQISCVNFVKRRRSKKRRFRKFLTIRQSSPLPGKRCKATVGTVVARPTMNLSSACSKGQILHEIMHVLGFAHEHARPDRDKFVKIHCENILSNLTNDFRKLKANVVQNFGEEYDFYSIMHYRVDHFSSNGKPTIEPLADGVNIEKVGEMDKLSSADIRKLRALYPCDKYRA